MTRTIARNCDIGILTLMLVVWTASATRAQNTVGPITELRSPEIFAEIGTFRAGTDEGSIGTAASYGGVIVVPFSARFAAALDGQTSRVVGDRLEGAVPEVRRSFVAWRTLVIPSLIYRFGAASVYGFIGSGVGVEFDNKTTRLNTHRHGFHEVLPGVFEHRQSEANVVASSRVGVVAFPTRKFGIRGDVYFANYSLGARIGIGYRFR